MNSPIPEPTGADRPPLVHGERPRLLYVLLCLELLLVALQIIFYEPMAGSKDPGAERTTTIVLAMIWVGLLYMLWEGQNWARITLIVGSVLGVLGIFGIGSQSALNQALTVANTILACVWIYFLSSRPAVEFTKGKPPAG